SILPATMMAQDAASTSPAGAGSPPPPPPPPPPQMPERPPLPDVSNITQEQRINALETMGYAMATQIGMGVGFNEEDVEHILNGVRKAALDQPQPESFEESMPVAQALYMAKREELQKREDAKAEEAARQQIEEQKPF